MRKNPGDRRREILNFGIKIAKKCGYKKITMQKVSKKLGISPPLMHHYFNNVEELKNEIIKEALENGIVEIIAQLMVFKDARVNNISDTTKKQAIDFISS